MELVCVYGTGEDFFHHLGLSATVAEVTIFYCYGDSLLLLLWWSSAVAIEIIYCCYSNHLLLLWWLSATAAMVDICCYCYGESLPLLRKPSVAASMVSFRCFCYGDRLLLLLWCLFWWSRPGQRKTSYKENLTICFTYIIQQFVYFWKLSKENTQMSKTND